jgi:Flp pilus assembly protein TadG
MRRRRRTSQAGQAVVITALMATVIFGAMALTVDLSLHTFNQRTLQNVADAAALAGATDLGVAPSGAQQQQGITDALSTIKQNQGFPTTWTGAATATTCTNSALVSGYCETVIYQNYTVRISAPPQTANGSSNRSANDFEVDVYVNVANNFGAFVGTSTSTVGAHAVAYNSGPPNPYNYTFFSAQQTDSGNQQETITGDAYLGAGYNPQAANGGGKSGLCVYQVPEASNDTDGDTTDNDLDEQGHVVFSSATPSVGIEPSYSQSTAPCASSTAGFNAQATAPLASGANCPVGSAPGADPSQPGGYNCWVANPPVPLVTVPTCGAGTPVPPPDCHTNVCTQTIDSASSGVYLVNASAVCTVTLDFSNNAKNAGNISCVDIVLGTGSQVVVNNKKSNQYVTSYGYNVGDTLANNAMTAIGATHPAASCTGAGLSTPSQTYDCVICAPATTGNPVVMSNNSTGCCSDTLFIGSVFLPGQQIKFATNQAMEDVGQIYCGYWNVQSGNHPNPTVTHDNGATDLLAETLRLVE